MALKPADSKREDALSLEHHEGEQKTIRGYKGMIGKLQAEIGGLQAEIGQLKAPKEPDNHVFTPYLPFCAGGCGARNLGFKKSEVRCSGPDCPMHTIGLGTLEEAKKLEACPGCGKSGNILQRMSDSKEEGGDEDVEEEDIHEEESD